MIQLGTNRLGRARIDSLPNTTTNNNNNIVKQWAKPIGRSNMTGRECVWKGHDVIDMRGFDLSGTLPETQLPDI